MGNDFDQTDEKPDTSFASVRNPFIPVLCDAADFSSPVVSVLDGDTLEVLHIQRPERIRLNGIDCPEKGQAYGMRASKPGGSYFIGG